MGLGRDLTEAELAEARNTAKELLLQIGSMEEVEATSSSRATSPTSARS